MQVSKQRELGVGYAVSLVDVNGDGKLDIVVVDQTRVVWYEAASDSDSCVIALKVDVRFY